MSDPGEEIVTMISRWVAVDAPRAALAVLASRLDEGPAKSLAPCSLHLPGGQARLYTARDNRKAITKKQLKDEGRW